VGIWASASLALAATVATSAEHCPLSTEFERTVTLNTDAPEQQHRYLITGSAPARVGVEVSASSSDAAAAEVEVVLLHEGPELNFSDEFRTLQVSSGTSANVTLHGSSAFQLGLRSLGPEPVEVAIRVGATIDACSDDRFVKVDQQ